VSRKVAVQKEKRSAADRDKERLSLLTFQAMESLAFGVVIIGAQAAERTVVYANPAFQRITGFNVADGLGKRCRLLGGEAAESDPVRTLRRAIEEAKPCRVELANTLNGVEQGWIEFSVSPIRGPRGEVTHLLGLVQDVTAARETMDHLERSESELRTIMMSVEEGIQLWDAEGRLVYANPAALRQFGSDSDGMAGDVDRQLFGEDGSIIEADDLPAHRVLRTGQPEDGVILRALSASGESKWIRIHAHPILDPESGRLLGAVSSSADTTRSVEQEQHLERLAHYDSLTQLPNRVLLADRMQQVSVRAQRSQESFAVGIMDLDGFKPVNDTYGHKAGDQILRDVAQRLETCVREGDTVARVGGDEFALLLTRFGSILDCEKILQRILNALSAPYLVNGEVVRLSTSIGVTIYPDDPTDSDKLLRHADQAMYQAKQEGKNRFKFFDTGREQRYRANQGTLRKIGDALAASQFVVHYQPVVDCRRGEVVGAEALVRWQHPILGLLSPAEFLPLIERDDLIDALGEWVLNEVLAQIDSWRGQGLGLDVSVNIASHQLHQRGFAERVRELMANHEPDTAKRLSIEIVETAALEDVNAVSALIGQLREAGVRVALDDFGTGFSSLVHLRRLPVDTLKIDQSFVRDMLDDPLDLAIVEGIIGLSLAFQYRPVAEGVESIDHILMLLELGCDRMQGYAIARPKPAAAFLDWVKAFRPDPLWELASSPRPNRSDFHILLAEANHRHWVDRVVACSGEPGGEAPNMDYRQCRFGQWYYGEGMRRYGKRREYLALGSMHRTIHELGEQLLSLAQSNDADAYHAVLKQINEGRDALVERLKQIRWAWPEPADEPRRL
jgi:diguanylate cyclase (GGDEF)-like protein/PAS domain S-box-containing protein